MEILDILLEVLVRLSEVGIAIAGAIVWPIAYVLEKLSKLVFSVLNPNASSTFVEYSSYLIGFAFVLLGFFSLYWMGSLLFKPKNKVLYKKYFAGGTALVILIWFFLHTIIGEPGKTAFAALLMGAFGIFTIPVFIVTFLYQKFIKRRMNRKLFITLSIFPFFLLFSLVIWFFNPDNAAGSNYHTLHAAIKNTCLMDLKKEHCPQKLEDIGIVEPGHFASAMKDADMYYQYDPATNQYTFVVRYSRYRAVIFSQQLFTPDYQLDFKEVRVATIGQDRIIDPPNYPGPWKLKPWRH